MTETKAELRTRMRAERKRLKLALPDAGVQAASHAHTLLAAQPFEARTVALYAPLGSEIDTGPLAAGLTRRGLRLALPRVDAENRPLVFHAWAPGDPLSADLQGCQAPSPDAEVVDPDLFILPLVAFDRTGGRLGQGGGYYDRTLAALRGRLRPAFVGLAFAGQEVSRVPVDAHDQKLDGILTERGYMPARKDA
jgi:5-formyltetrahydrofolate cyclo-ligase